MGWARRSAITEKVAVIRRLPIASGLAVPMLAIVLLAGCAVGPNYRPRPAAALGVPAAWSTAQTGVPEPVDLAVWWNRFDDPELTSLIERAAAGNFDVAAAVARLLQAREALVQAGTARYPSVTGSAGATRSFAHGGSTTLTVPDGQGGTSTIVQSGNSTSTQLSLGLDASWSVDLFGGIRRGIQAARADRDTAAFDLEGVRTALAAEVAQNYIDARLAQARLAIARDTLRNQSDNLDIAGWRVQAGLVSSVDSEQARAQRAQTASAIPGLEQSFAAAANRLAVLTGQAPGALKAELAATAPIPHGPDAIQTGIPADTLRRRPDVRSAERALAAATARIGVAKAQLFPALAITGNFATTATSFAKIGDMLQGGVFAGLTQLIFDAGKVASQVRGARAATDAAYATYRQTILTGLEDVENGVQALESSKGAQVQLAVAADASNNAAIYARSQYRAGLTDFQTLLTSEQTLLTSRDALAQAQANQALALVQLYLALGGGWTPAAAPAQNLLGKAGAASETRSSALSQIVSQTGSTR